MKLRHCGLLILFLVFLAASSVQAAEIHLFAAASLKECLNEISDSYARTRPGLRFVRSYGGSGTLALQLQSGAPVDIFISANTEWVSYLLQKNLLSAGSVRDFTYNTLVFVGRPETRVSSLNDLPRLKRIAIGSPRSVPAGEYAMDALKRSGLERQLAKKLVLAKDVRQCLLYAERGEVDGALVYRTDALQAGNVKILFEVPQELYPRVTYPMALTHEGSKNREARAFFRYLEGREARAILAKRGFASR